MLFSINEKPKFRCTLSRNHHHHANVFPLLFFSPVFIQLLPEKRHANEAWEPAKKVLFFISPPPILNCLSLLPSPLSYSILLLLLLLSLLSVYLRRPGFDPKSVHVRFVVDKVSLGQVFLRLLQTSPVSVIPPVLHTDSFINTLLSSQGQMDKAR